MAILIDQIYFCFTTSFEYSLLKCVYYGQSKLCKVTSETLRYGTILRKILLNGLLKIFVNSSTTLTAHWNQPVMGQRLIAGHCQFAPLWFIVYVRMILAGFISSILLRDSILCVGIGFKSSKAYSVIVSNPLMRQNALCVLMIVYKPFASGNQ